MLDIYPLDLFIWHMPDIRLLQNFGGLHVTPYIWHILTWWRYMWYILHTYGVTWWPQYFVDVVYQAYVRYIDLVGICQAYIVICLSCLSYTWNILFSQKLELEYFRNMPYVYLTKSGIFYIPGGWSVSWCWSEKPCCTATWTLGVILQVFMTLNNKFLITHCMQTRTLVYIMTSCNTLHQCTMTDNTALGTVL
jgi:hypothetical protein